LVISSTLVSQSTLPSAYEDPEAYLVYAAILPSEFAVQIAKAKTLIIQSETTGYPMCLRPEKEWEEIIAPAIVQYGAVNSHPWRLQRTFSIDRPYKLLAWDQIHAAFGQSGRWDDFYGQYPDSGGFIQFSAVGFNPDETVAVVYVGHRCGGLCGGGAFQVLQKKDSKWLPLKWKGESCQWSS
jgi:hypothetical protein